MLGYTLCNELNLPNLVAFVHLCYIFTYMSVAKIISKRSTWSFSFFLLIFVVEVLFLRLAYWQYERMHEKEAAFAEYEKQLQQSPRLVHDFSTVEDWQIVRLKGQFVFDDEKLLQNRKYKSYSGYRLILPFKQTTGEVVMVDRGWIPKSFAKLDSEMLRDSNEVVELTGVVRFVPQKKGWLDGPLYGTTKRVIKRVDTQVFSTPVEYKHFLIQATSSGNQNIRSFVEKPKTGAQHSEYMLTWLALALIVPSLYAAFVFQRRRTLK